MKKTVKHCGNPKCRKYYKSVLKICPFCNSEETTNEWTIFTDDDIDFGRGVVSLGNAKSAKPPELSLSVLNEHIKKDKPLCFAIKIIGSEGSSVDENMKLSHHISYKISWYAVELYGIKIDDFTEDEYLSWFHELKREIIRDDNA